MSVIRVEKNKNYTVMSNYHLKEKNMSLKAKGLLSLMLSLPDDWDYSIAGLVAICKENETAIKSTLKELEDFGYMRVDKLTPDKTDTGRFEYIYNIFEKSQKQEGKKQGVENLPVEILGVENQVQLNTNKQNTNKLNTKRNINRGNSRKSKKDTILEKIVKKSLEYDLTDNVIELLEKFFSDLIDNNKLVTDSKIEAILSNLAKESVNTQIKAIQLSLDKGYMNIDCSWLDNKPAKSNQTWQELNKSQTIADETDSNYTF